MQPFPDELHPRAILLLRKSWSVPAIQAELEREFQISPSATTLYKWKRADQVTRGIRCRYCERNDWHNGTLCRTCGYNETDGRFERDHPLVRGGAVNYHP